MSYIDILNATLIVLGVAGIVAGLCNIVITTKEIRKEE